MSPLPSFPQESRKYLCVPVELKQPLQLNEFEAFPKVRFEDIPQPPLRMTLVILKALLMAVCALGIWHETSQIPDSSRIQLFQTVLTIFDLTFIMPLAGLPLASQAIDKYATRVLAYLFIYLFRTLSTLVLFLYSVYVGKISFIYFTASVSSILIEVVNWTENENSYIVYMKWQEEFEEELIKEVKNTFGSENNLGEPFVNQFRLEPVSRELVWPRLKDDSEEYYTLPTEIYSQTKEGETEYFVPFSSYKTVYSKINKDIPKCETLIGRNKQLRRDLIRQSALIINLKKKIYGPDVDTKEEREWPDGPYELESWRPANVEGMLVLCEDEMQGFVSLADFRAAVIDSETISIGFDDLETENEELKQCLQQRQVLNNFHLVRVLRMKFPNEINKYKSINDVD